QRRGLVARHLGRTLTRAVLGHQGRAHADHGQGQAQQGHGLQGQAARHGSAARGLGSLLLLEHRRLSPGGPDAVGVAYCSACALSTRPMSALDIRASMSIRISMRSATLAMPVMKLVSIEALISGAGLIRSP